MTSPQARHLVIIAHPDDELVFMSPAMFDILRSDAPVKIIYLTAGDAAQLAPYWRAREAGIARAHAVLRPARSPVPVERVFLRLADGMLDGRGSPVHHHESLIQLWRGDIPHMQALDQQARYSREDVLQILQDSIAQWCPTVLHTLNGRASGEAPPDHPDHQATGLFAVAAALAAAQAVGDPAAGDLAAGDLAAGDLAAGDLAAGDLAAGHLPASHQPVPSLEVRMYVGSNSPHRPANVTGDALAEKIAIFATYAEHDAEINNGRRDWITASIYAPMLERQYVTRHSAAAMRIEGESVVV